MKTILLFTITLCYLNSYSQNYFISGGNKICIWKVYAPFNLRKIAEFKNENAGEFKGYKISGDSLICYFQVNNSRVSKVFSLSDLQYSIPIFNPLYKENNNEVGCTHYIHRSVDKEFFICSGFSIIICKNKNIILQKTFSRLQKEYKEYDELQNENRSLNSIKAIFNNLFDNCVFATQRSGIFGVPEVWLLNLTNGELKKIAKGYNPSFSIDGRFILYNNYLNGESNIYSVRDEKVSKLGIGEKVFWFVK